jgi:hypothetical protein
MFCSIPLGLREWTMMNSLYRKPQLNTNKKRVTLMTTPNMKRKTKRMRVTMKTLIAVIMLKKIMWVSETPKKKIMIRTVKTTKQNWSLWRRRHRRRHSNRNQKWRNRPTKIKIFGTYYFPEREDEPTQKKTLQPKSKMKEQTYQNQDIGTYYFAEREDEPTQCRNQHWIDQLYHQERKTSCICHAWIQRNACAWQHEQKDELICTDL